MRFTMFVKNLGEVDSTAWPEKEDRPTLVTEAEVREWAANIIREYNRTLRPNERARALVRVTLTPDETPIQSDEASPHDWHKTNGVTIIKGSLNYDTLRCSQCGVTGKRYGVGGTVERDPKFKANIYAKCATARAHLAKKSLHA